MEIVKQRPSIYQFRIKKLDRLTKRFSILIRPATMRR